MKIDALTLRSAVPIACSLLIWASASGSYISCARAHDLQIEHVTIISAERPGALRDASVSIHDDKIVAILDGAASAAPKPAPPRAADVIDGRGLYLVPGLIDSHVHLGAIAGMNDEQEKAHPGIASIARRQVPRSFLLYGFTTLIDLISTPEQMERWSSQTLVPDTYFCGAAALLDGYPMNYMPKPARYRQMPYLLIEPGTQAPPGIDPGQHSPQAVVRRMKDDGAICVKTFYERGFGAAHNLPVPRLETVQALVRAAHVAGLPVLLHANSSEAQAFGLKAGVDILAHGLWNWDEPGSGSALTPAIRTILDGVLSAHVGWQPTIQVLYGERDLFNPSYLSDPELIPVVPASLIDWYRSAEGQWFRNVLSEDLPPADRSDPHAADALMKRWDLPISRAQNATGYLATHGARLLFGTDTPSAPTYANPPGLNGWLEMQRLVAAGESPAQIFRSATLENARALKLDHEIGSVEVGKRANLLLLREDPSRSIQAYRGIVKVILRGRVIDPSELAANPITQ